jgi:FAD:protein FMN transferase
VEAAVLETHDLLLEMHARLSRFEEDSELCAVNREPRGAVAASPLFQRFTAAAVSAARLTAGLVDPTRLSQLEDAGYERSWDPAASLPLPAALESAPRRRAARPSPAAAWKRIAVDRRLGVVSRPAGLRLDSGGVAKGLGADMAAELLDSCASFAVDCGGDIRIGGQAAEERTILVEDPFTGEPVHELQLRRGAVGTSGIGRRSWLDLRGRPAHHLIDPSTGRPAYTGIVQATALASSALAAEAFAKAAVLSGPGGAARWLVHGGVLVLDDGSVEVVVARRHLEGASIR